MHSVADIVVGLGLSSFLLVGIVPLVDSADSYLLCSPLSPLITITSSLLAALLYPTSDRWTPARGDTTAALGSYLGVHLGSWLNYQLGMISQASTLPPYTVAIPDTPDICLMVLRVLVGGLVAWLTFSLAKPVTLEIGCFLLGTTRDTNNNKHYATLFYKVVISSRNILHNNLLLVLHLAHCLLHRGLPLTPRLHVAGLPHEGGVL